MDVPNRYAAYLMWDGQWRQSWWECQAASRNNTYLHGSSPISLFLRSVWSAYMPGSIKTVAHRLSQRGAPLAQSVINPKFARKLRLVDRSRLQEVGKGQLLPGNLRQAHARVLNSTTVGILLGLTGYEHMAGRYGVELRDPWADNRVVEFFLRLPLRCKVRDGWTKYMARTTFAPDLEQPVRERLGKEHLGWRFAERLMEDTATVVLQTWISK